MTAAEYGRAVEIPCAIHGESSRWLRAVAATGETVQHGVGLGGCDCGRADQEQQKKHKGAEQTGAGGWIHSVDLQKLGSSPECADWPEIGQINCKQIVTSCSDGKGSWRVGV